MKRQSTILYILIFLVAAITLLLVFADNPLSELNTVPVILPSASSDGDGDESPPVTPPQPIEVTPDTVQAVIRTLSRAEAYSRTLTAESYLEGETLRKIVDVWVKDGSSKLEISRSDRDETMNILIADGEKWLWYTGLYGSYHGAAAENEADRYQSLLSYEKLLQLSKASITGAGYTDYRNEMCIYVRYDSPLPGQENVCYVSLTEGLAVGEESYMDGELIFSATATAADLHEPEDSHFRLP